MRHRLIKPLVIFGVGLGSNPGVLMTLDQLRPGQQGRIESVNGAHELVQRLFELGLFEGERIEMLAIAPLGDPIAIRCGSTRLGLRKLEAASVRITLDA